MDCQYCKKTLNTLSSLNYHQKNAKYCLKIQGKNINININISNFICQACETNLASQQSLYRHYTSCIKYQIKMNKENIQSNTDVLQTSNDLKDNEILSLKAQVKELQDQLASIAREAASRPTHVQNNNNQRINTIINNMLPITDEHLEEQVQYLTMEHVKNGASGYAKYALEYPLKNRIACVDFARRKIKYKNKDGDIIVDPDMSKLTQKLFLAIESRNSMLIDTYIKELGDKWSVMNREAPMDMNENEHVEFSERMDGVVDFMIEESSKMRDVKQISKGVKSDVYNEFIKEVCSGSL